jgi:uncharacterized protein (TIGR03435 family)
MDDLIANEPSWMRFELFDVDAVAPSPETTTRSELYAMLQTLLAHRFKLRIHPEHKQVQGYAVVVLVIDSVQRPRGTDMRYALGIALIVAVFVPGMIITAAQNQALKFEVASVKPSSADTSKSIGSVLLFLPGGGFRRTNVTLKSLIQTAYSVQDFQVSGAAGWMESEIYDIEAKASAGTDPTRVDVLLMVQTLLADRFKLQLHHEMKDTTRYVLMTGKNGIKMKLATDAAGGAKGTNGRITGKRTMPQLADLLSAVLDRPVVDQTGLSGQYEFTLEWLPELSQTGPGSPPPNPSAPSIFTALQEQLGLRLEAMKGNVQVIIIDHAEKPDAN